MSKLTHLLGYIGVTCRENDVDVLQYEKKTLPRIRDMSSILSTSFSIEQKQDKGEDADPTLQIYEDQSGLISVFDGLGGAGSTPYETEGGIHTGAYYAARFAKEVVEHFFEQVKKSNQRFDPHNTISALKSELAKSFKSRIVALDKDKNSSKLRSSLIRRLPTTMATIYFEKAEAISDQYQCHALWAGDSRCYLLDNTRGLQQLSKDDIKSGGDALENLMGDSPLSNYINADVDFALNSRSVTIDSPSVLIVATDGCFQYVPTPSHFEHLLLYALKDSTSTDEWRDKLVEKFRQIAGDDVSLALVAIGWKNIEELKQDFEPRCRRVDAMFIRPLDEIDSKLKTLKQDVNTYEQDKEVLRRDLWNTYKQDYEYRLNELAQAPDGDSTR